jgi:hypothetical protein
MNKTIEILIDEQYGGEIYELTYSVEGDAGDAIEPQAIKIIMLKDSQGHDITSDVSNPFLEDDEFRRVCIEQALENEERSGYLTGWDDAISGVKHKGDKGAEYERGYSDSYAKLESLANKGSDL